VGAAIPSLRHPPQGDGFRKGSTNPTAYNGNYTYGSSQGRIPGEDRSGRGQKGPTERLVDFCIMKSAARSGLFPTTSVPTTASAFRIKSKREQADEEQEWWIAKLIIARVRQLRDKLVLPSSQGGFGRH
jgi:hypothetical protein